MPKHHRFHLISIAIGIEALLLHGETRPFDVSSSQSNQRVSSWQGGYFNLQANYRRSAVGKVIAVSGQSLRISSKSLPTIPAPVLVERKTSIARWPRGMLVRE